MNDTVYIEWQYTPADFLEEPLEQRCPEYELTIADGKVSVQMTGCVYDQAEDWRQKLDREVHSRLTAAQAIDLRDLEIRGPRLRRVSSAGSTTIVMLGTLTARATVSRIDFIVRDVQGNVIGDTKRDRLNRQKRLMDLAAKHSEDHTVAAMLHSFAKAAEEPEHELAHLYGVLDALKERFGREKRAMTELRIPDWESRGIWGRLSRLANDRAIKQGRHSGRATVELRNATQPEREEARRIAAELWEGFLAYLDRIRSV